MPGAQSLLPMLALQVVPFSKVLPSWVVTLARRTRLTWLPAACLASREVQGALQQVKPGLDERMPEYFSCSSRQHPVGTWEHRKVK